VPKTVAVGNLVVGKIVGLFVVEVLEGLVVGNGVKGALEGLSVVGAAVVVGTGVRGAELGAIVQEQGSMTSQACCHAPPYSTENGSNPTWLHSLSRVGIAAVDLHLKI
jgi:hypothetical protein